MFLPCVPLSVRLILIGGLLGLLIPTLSVRAFQQQDSPAVLNQPAQQSFDPPGDPIPGGTRGAGSRGIVVRPSMPNP
jgi:hypothetical protein